MSKKKFTFWYSETYTYKGWFEAESEGEARDMLDKVWNSDLDMEDDLPEFGNKDKGFELEVDLGTLEEVAD